MAKLELTSNHSLQKQHTNYLRDRTWPFTYSLFCFMFKLSGDHKETSDHDWTPTTQSPLLSTYPNRSGWSNQCPQSTVNQHYLGAPLMSCIRRNEDTTAVHKKTTTNSLLINSNFSLYECIMYLDRMRCMLSSKKKINNRLAVGNKDRIKDNGSILSSINCLSFHYK